MHLIDSVDVLLDPDGIDIPEDAVAQKTLASARDCIAGDVRGGRVDLRYRIDVHDKDDDITHSLSFADAVEIIR
jgi:hypothetical protein